MGRYSNSIGVGQLIIDEDTILKIKPETADVERFTAIQDRTRKTKNISEMYKLTNDFIYDLVVTYDPSHTDEEKEELKKLISLNQVPLQEQLMILFKFTTKEKLKQLESTQGEQIKNLING